MSVCVFYKLQLISFYFVFLDLGLTEFIRPLPFLEDKERSLYEGSGLRPGSGKALPIQDGQETQDKQGTQDGQ